VDDSLRELGLALALMLVIEGLLYALLPDVMRKIMAFQSTRPVALLRWTGVASVAAGVGFVWVVRHM
jgi:uncharacterized protein